jgi:hypothetical protein
MSQFFYGPATTHKDDHFAKITALKLEENTKVNEELYLLMNCSFTW